MARAIGDYPLRPGVRCNPPVPSAQVGLLWYRLVYGSSGAVGATSEGSPGVSVTNPAGTGLYDVTYPGCRKARVQLTHIGIGTNPERRRVALRTVPTSTVARFANIADDGTSGVPADADGTETDVVEIQIACEY
jgi:hypothetical protein